MKEDGRLPSNFSTEIVDNLWIRPTKRSSKPEKAQVRAICLDVGQDKIRNINKLNEIRLNKPRFIRDRKICLLEYFSDLFFVIGEISTDQRKLKI